MSNDGSHLLTMLLVRLLFVDSSHAHCFQFPHTTCNALKLTSLVAQLQTQLHTVTVTNTQTHTQSIHTVTHTHTHNHTHSNTQAVYTTTPKDKTAEDVTCTTYSTAVAAAMLPIPTKKNNIII